EEHVVAPHITHPEIEDDDEPILLDVEGLVERDGAHAVTRDLALEDGIRIREPDDLQPSVRREGLDDGARDDRLDPGLGRAVLEDGHRHGAKGGRKRAGEGVAARADRQGREGQGEPAKRPPHARVTILTSRLATTTTRSTARSRTHGCTRSSASAR